MLAELYTRCIQQEQLPVQWKAGEGILLPKSQEALTEGAPLTAKAYPVIVLHPAIAKIFERTVLNRMLYYRKLQMATSPRQHGFTKSRSCYTAIAQLVDELQTPLGARKLSGSVFLDVQGTFDRVPHPHLVAALEAAGMPQGLTDTIRDYLDNRQTRLRIGPHTHIVSCTQGTPQGGVLSPQLWTIYLETLLNSAHKLAPVSLQAYADDLVLWAHHRTAQGIQKQLQQALNRLASWSTQLQLQFQPQKTFVMAFCYRKTPPRLMLTLKGVPLQQVSQTRYLGIQLDQHFTWHAHIQSLIPRATEYTAKLLPAV